jgi:PAS domain S-box-containing protein
LSTQPQKSTVFSLSSFRQAAQLRLLVALALSFVCVTIAALFMLRTLEQANADEKIRDTSNYFEVRGRSIEGRWISTAEVMRSQFVYTQLLSEGEPRLRQARFTTFLDSFGANNPFEITALIDADGKILARHGVKSANASGLLQRASSNTGNWVFDESSRVLYRVVRARLVSGGKPAQLLFLGPLDNAALTRLTFPGVSLRAFWKGEPVAQSLNESPTDASWSQNVTVATAEVPWLRGADESPVLQITRQFPESVSSVQVIAVFAATGILLLAMLWLLLGQWVKQIIDRLTKLRRTTRSYGESVRLGRADELQTARKHLVTQSEYQDELGELSASFVKMLDDVSAKEQALTQSLEQLRESETRFRAAFDLSPVPVVLIDFESGKVIDINAEALSEISLSPSEAANLKADELFRWQSSNERKNFIARLGESGSVRNHPTSFKLADGSSMSALVSAAVIDLGGRKSILATLLDITELARVEAALVESEQRYRLIVDAMSEGVVLHRADGALEEVNAAAEQLLGASEDQLRGKLSLDPGWEILDERGNPLAQSDFPSSRAMATRRPQPPTLLQVRHPDGHTTWIGVNALPLSMRNLGGTGALVTISDRTVEIQARTTLKNLNALLESQVSKRTSELAAANQELEAFSYMVSHDLRSPLRAIEGFADLLQRQLNEAKPLVPEYVGHIHQGALRMQQMIQDLLSLASVSKAPLTLREIDLSQLCKEVSDGIGRDTVYTHTTWQIQPGMRAHVDLGLARNVFENLLGNAAKYSSKAASPTVSISLGRNDNEWLEVVIIDNGAGFDSARARGLFTPFRRMHSERDFEGSGIGLAIVKKIMDRHGGMVGVDSQVGQGARFWLRFPKTNTAFTQPDAAPRSGFVSNTSDASLQ